MSDGHKYQTIQFPVKIIKDMLTKTLERLERVFCHIPQNYLDNTCRNAMAPRPQYYTYLEPPDDVENKDYKTVVDIVFNIREEIENLDIISQHKDAHESFSESIFLVNEMAQLLIESYLYKELHIREIVSDFQIEKLQREIDKNRKQRQVAAIIRHKPLNEKYNQAIGKIKNRINRNDKPEWKHNDYVNWVLMVENKDTEEKIFEMLRRETLLKKTAEMLRKDLLRPDLILGEHKKK